MTYKSFKYRIYPNAQQEKILAQNFGARRWVFNYFLEEQKRRYEAGEKHLSHFDINKQITALKKQPDTSWLKEMDDELSPHATSGVGDSIIPVALQKMASKIERSGHFCRLVMGVGKPDDI
jgi:hypothetical protein